DGDRLAADLAHEVGPGVDRDDDMQSVALRRGPSGGPGEREGGERGRDEAAPTAHAAILRTRSHLTWIARPRVPVKRSGCATAGARAIRLKVPDHGPGTHWAPVAPGEARTGQDGRDDDGSIRPGPER